MRVYIKPEHEEAVGKLGIDLRKHGELIMDNVSPVSEFYFEIDDTGFWGDDKKVSTEFIKGVTIYLYVGEGFIKPGIYEHGEARAEVDTHMSSVGESYHEELLVQQVIRIVASSIEGAREILSLLRQGKIEPKEEWTGHANEYVYVHINHPADSDPTHPKD